MPKQIILYNLRDDVNLDDYVKWVEEFKGPLLLKLPSAKSFTLLKMLGGKTGDGTAGIMPEDTSPPYQLIGILDVTSPEAFMQDTQSKAYQEEFFPKFFKNWGARFYAIMSSELYQGTSD